MIAAVIRASLRNRLLVILAALMMASWGSARRWTRCPICLMCRSLSKRVTPGKRRR